MTYRGYSIEKYDTPQVVDLGNGESLIYRYYVPLSTTDVRFETPKEAKEWCSKNYLKGVAHGWIEA